MMPELRATWMQARSIETSGRADQYLDGIEAAGYNAILANVVAYGHAYYDSELLDKHPDVALVYDPLAYLVEQAHERGIQVHAWIIGGPLGYNDGPGSTFVEHPDWVMMSPDGREKYWLNYNRPEVQEFVGDLVLEIVRNYDVDGVHFDYTRYPDSGWGYDPYSGELAAEEAGLDLELLRYSELPAYANFQGNPLTGVDSAQVLAEFDGGQPAVVLNDYGAGRVLLLNWDALERQIAASSIILDRGLDMLLGEGGQVFVLYADANEKGSGARRFEDGVAWLEHLGRQPVRVTEAELSSLDENGVLVFPGVYEIGAQTASDLADFVDRGGGAIFIDGPTPSIGDKNLRAVLGMRSRGTYFREPRLLEATRAHELIPSVERDLSKKDHRNLADQWRAFRMDGISKTLQEATQRVKQESPEVLVSITVSGDQNKLAEQYMLDWKRWLQEETVDLIIPRAYVEEDEALGPVVADWKPFMDTAGHIALGLIVYSNIGGEKVPKTAQRMLDEIQHVYDKGSNGAVLFDIEHTSFEILEALAGGWSSP